jgi:hypothetical protein
VECEGFASITKALSLTTDRPGRVTVSTLLVQGSKLDRPRERLSKMQTMPPRLNVCGRRTDLRMNPKA